MFALTRKRRLIVTEGNRSNIVLGNILCEQSYTSVYQIDRLLW